MWKEGWISVPADGVLHVVRWQAKVFEEGSVLGINGGKISKLCVWLDGKEVVGYDRGWYLEPDLNNHLISVAYSIVLQELN